MSQKSIDGIIVSEGISFPFHLNVEESRILMEHIALTAHANVVYDIAQHNVAGFTDGPETHTSGHTLFTDEHYYTKEKSEIKGRITSVDEAVAFDFNAWRSSEADHESSFYSMFFRLVKNNEDSPKILKEPNQNILRFWNSVQSSIESYFKEKPKSKEEVYQHHAISVSSGPYHPSPKN